MSLETGNVETDVLFNRLSYKQVRHIVLLEAIVELAKLEVEKWKNQDSDGACGVESAIDVITHDLMGLSGGLTITSYDPKCVALNAKMFERVDISDDEDQMLVYESAIGTSKYRLEKILEMLAK